MKKLNLEEMEVVQGGTAQNDWCDSVQMLYDSGFDFDSVNSGGYVEALFSVHCN